MTNLSIINKGNQVSEVDNELDGEDLNSQDTETKQTEEQHDIHGMSDEQFSMFAYTTLRECMREVYTLQAREEFVLKDKEKIHAEILEANNFIEEKPQYQKYLQNLQKALYEQNINVFNQLLTYFVRDVLKTDKGIEMELFVSRGMPGIRIEAVNSGFKENIIDGSGGAIANIVSTGLRLICLSRLPHRKFIILDEPDCWIKPEFVPAFAKIIGELSRKLRIQTVIISHHSWEYFKDYGRVIELEKDGAILEANIKHDTAIDEQTKKQDYIAEVHLRRFMSHYNTVYKLHPFLTCIIGKNDLGKSVIAAAMKALAFNDSSDSCVKHNENSAQVFARLSVGDGILWERFKVKEKGQEQKVKYTLLDSEDNYITSEFNSYDVPEFINSKLRIMKSEDIDVHISSQKTPVFMIGNDVSPANKAKILSLGKEILVIQQMMSHINSTASEYSALKKKNEPLYDQYIRELKLLSDVHGFIPTFEKLEQHLTEIKEEIAEINAMNEMIPKIEQLKKLQSIPPVMGSVIVPQFEDEDEINNILWQLDFGSKYSEIKQIKPMIAAPQLEDLTEINRFIKTIASLDKLKDIEKVNTLPIPSFEDEETINIIVFAIDQHQKYNEISKVETLPMLELEDETVINDILFRMDDETKNIEDTQKKIAILKKKQENLEQRRQELDARIHEEYEKSGTVCPTCKQQVSFETYKEHLV